MAETLLLVGKYYIQASERQFEPWRGKFILTSLLSKLEHSLSALDGSLSLSRQPPAVSIPTMSTGPVQSSLMAAIQPFSAPF